MFARSGKNGYVKFSVAHFAYVFIHAVAAGSIFVNVFQIVRQHGNFFDIHVLFAIAAIIERSADFRAGGFFRSGAAFCGRGMRMRTEEQLFERGVFRCRESEPYGLRSFGKFDKSVFVGFDFRIAHESGNFHAARICFIAQRKSPF